MLAERLNLQLYIYCAQQKRLILGIFKHVKFLVELCPAMSGDYTTEFSVKCKLHHTLPAKLGYVAVKSKSDCPAQRIHALSQGLVAIYLYSKIV